MKSISTLFIAIVALVISSNTQAQTTYTISSSRTWSNNNGNGNTSSNNSLPTFCANCTFNIADGVTLTIDNDVVLQNPIFNGGTISMTNKAMVLQMYNGAGTAYFNTTVLVNGTSSITASEPLVITNSTFKFFNTSKIITQHLFDLTNSKFYFNDDSYVIATGGPVNLKNNSQLVAGNGTLSSKAYIMMNGPALNVYDNSAVVLGNNNNYYFNWSSYYSGSKNANISTAVNKYNCGSGYPNSCVMPYVYGPLVLNTSGASVINTLPIVLSDFTASLKNHTVSLTWTTQQEENASRFEIESSTDGLKWKKIGTVKAAGNTNTITKYSFTDANPADGANFYRLKLVDVDETFEYSAVRKVQHTASQNVSVYPNPAQSFVNVFVPQSNSATTTVRLMSTSGQILQEHTMNGGTVALPVQQYAAGTYFVQIVKADGFKQNSVLLINK